MKKTSLPIKNSLFLFLAAAIWGIAFVAQSIGMEYVGPFTFNGIRSLIGALVLLPVIFYFGSNTSEKAATSPKFQKHSRRTLWSGGFLCGLALFAASNFQQFGIKYTSVGKAGFITACYIVLVPVLGLFLKKSVGAHVWIAVFFSVVGLYLLCMNESFAISRGDFLCMIGSLLFACHILIIDHYSPLTNGVQLSCIQFLVCGLLSTGCALLFEAPEPLLILAAWKPILYAGVMSCGVAYTLQILGQRDVSPAIASLILSLESCISVISGWLILGQTLSAKEICGCIIMFAAILLAQFPVPQNVKKKKD